MDSIKTGKFIAILRKEKGLSQKMLGEKLNVTDKAVSRWETGKGYPDVSLLPVLSSELGVTINEILIGERIPIEYQQNRAEETIVKTLKEKKRILWIINLFVFLFSGFSLYISLKLFYNMGIFVDEFNTSPDVVCGGIFWLYMDWLRLALLAVVTLCSGIKLFTRRRSNNI